MQIERTPLQRFSAEFNWQTVQIRGAWGQLQNILEQTAIEPAFFNPEELMWLRIAISNLWSLQNRRRVCWPDRRHEWEKEHSK